MAMNSSNASRLESLPKKDRDEVLRLWQIYRERGDCLEQVQKEIRKFATSHRCVPCPPSGSLGLNHSLRDKLAWSFGWLKSAISSGGILRRLQEDDPRLKVAGLSLAARLDYLLRLAGGEAYSGTDCAHMFAVFVALAVHDRYAVDRFVNQFPGPFKGTSTGALISNATYAVIRRDWDAFSKLEARMVAKKEIRFFRAILDCLLAIAHKSASDVSQALADLAKGVRLRKDYITQLDVIDCVEAHALFNLASDVLSEAGMGLPTPPTASTWDTQFQELVSTGTKIERSRLIDIASLSPKLHQWIEELPTEVNAWALLADVTPGAAKNEDLEAPYTPEELQHLDPEAVPYRGVHCPACDRRIPKFTALSEQDALSLRLGNDPEAQAKLIQSTGCPAQFAQIWVAHPDGPRVPEPRFANCPHCGKKLATAKAKQCLHCGADWH